MDIGWEQTPAIIAQISMGIGLAACAGMRTFLPLLIVGLAGRFDVVPLTSSFDWLGSWPSLTVFGVAVLVEVLGDKFPVVDHGLDVVQTFAKPVAGTVLMASVVTDLGGLTTAVLAIVTGGTVAGGVHLAKSNTRLLSTATTGGLANPVLSTAEDGIALAGSVGAVFAPVVMVVLMAIGAIVAAVLLRRWWAARRRVAATA